jgi:glycosyltransferase involved in cell wall biosynthesis
VLTPFFRHDPSALLASFAKAPAGIEFVLLDDGSSAAHVLANVLASAERLGAPVRVIVWAANRGRAAARNRLIAEAKGEYVLLLDANMIPDSRAFLSCWLGIARTQNPDVAFGGASLRHTTSTVETALHHTLFGNSDCRAPRQRERSPAQSTASANLLVRREFLNAHPFDDGFVGWGFEDVDWALGAAEHTNILHVANPASYTGLDDIDHLMVKYAQAGPNFARLARKHPSAVRRLPAHRIASLLKRAPARTSLRRAFAWIARDPLGAAPMSLRCAALKLYRASHFADYLA